jgi:sialate O-acetylesterase
MGASQAETQADANGKWRVDLPPLPTNATGQTMTVNGKNTLTFQDVLIGDVWLASGQSNMELPLTAALNAKDAIPAATNPQIRLFLVKRQPGIIPKSDVEGAWMVCSPDAASPFSAIAYFFGQELQSSLHRPIGLVGSYWGGTFITAWIGFDALKALPVTEPGTEDVQRRIDAFPKDPTAQAATMTDYRAKLLDWQTNVETPYQAAMKQWQQDDAAAKAAGKPEPPQPQRSAPHPNSPDGEAWEYTVLFNGMINPLIPYGIKGVLWYQGESNSDSLPTHYQELLKTLITDWRTRWNQGDFPFLVVQIANAGARAVTPPIDSGWAVVREAEAKTAETLPKVGMAVTMDLGLGDIHPPDKLDVGKRLAATARNVAYGQDVPHLGPSYTGMTVDGNKIHLKFKDIGSGLVIGTPPLISLNAQPQPHPNLIGFAITGADKNWTWANAVIAGDEVIVSSDQVATPVAVRYGWADNVEINLYNKEGFPAVPFRTDNWEFVPPVRK